MLKKRGKHKTKETQEEKNCLGEKGGEMGANAALGAAGKEMGGRKGRKPLISPFLHFESRQNRGQGYICKSRNNQYILSSGKERERQQTLSL